MSGGPQSPPGAASDAPGPEPAAGQGRGRWLGAAKLLVAVVVLGLVVRSVPWDDRLVWQREGERVELEGTIEGDWTEDAVEFVAAGPEQLGNLPPDAQASFVDGRARVTRADGPEGWSWSPGMPRVFGALDAGGLATAMFLLVLGVLVTSTRWWRLLARAECPTTWPNAVRLTFIGFFFNIVLPLGLTGGDVIKAVMVARENPLRRARAAVSVLVDRLIGLFSLAVLGAAVVLALGQTFAELRLSVMLIVAGGTLAVVVYSNRALRRAVRFDAIVRRLPMSGLWQKIDEAALLYSRHPGELAVATGLSLVNHLLAILAIFALGRAFGDQILGLPEYVAAVAIGNIVSALPLTPGGWGFGEAAYAFLFDMMGGSRTIGFAVSVTFRLCLLAIGLFGGVFLLLPSGRAELAEVDA